MSDIVPGERRKIAAYLRGDACDRYDMWDAGTALMQELGEMGILDEEHPNRTLADLIDPTCEVVGVVGHAGEWKGDETYTFSLSCGHEIESEWPDPPDYCEECGRRIVRREDS